MKFLLMILFFNSLIFPQSNEIFNVESFVIIDSLSLNDPVEKNLGRYNNFEIHLNNGDFLSLNFSTNEFTPLILLVSPENEKFVFNSNNGKTINFIKRINYTGNWNLYVIGGENETGKYSCKIGFADSNSVLLKGKLNLCEFWHFVSAHSKSDFVFIKNKLNDIKQFFPEGINNNSEITTRDNKLEIVYRPGNIVKAFNNIYKSINKCLSDWNIRRKKATYGNISETISAVKSVSDKVIFIKINKFIESGKDVIKISAGILK